MPVEPRQAPRLARYLRELREQRGLTQAQLAEAFSAEVKVSAATISSWESTGGNSKVPSTTRLNAYARFFALERREGQSHPVAEVDLTDDERATVRDLEATLLGLLRSRAERLSTLTFDEGPITVICPEAPAEARGPLADETDPNFTKLHRYADLDSLIELWGHLRASNPALDVVHRIPADVLADDLSTHLILLGGIGWNPVTRRIQEALREVPVTQVAVDDLDSGEVFQVGEHRFDPEWDDDGQVGRVLSEDVAFLARLTNPFNSSRTLTICNGIHSRGVLGAVRCLTDKRVRDSNERYIADRFPGGRFALLLGVPVVLDETMSPDLQNPRVRRYEWSPGNGDDR